ncbi:hypothetical protein TB2_013840 [Malus domestica]
MPVRQLLVMLLKHLLGQLRARHNHVQHGPRPHQYDEVVFLGLLGVAAEPHGLNVVEVADNRPCTWAGRELESEPLVELVGKGNENDD